MPLSVQPRLLPSLLGSSSLLALVWLGTAAVPLVGRYVLEDTETVAQYNKAYLWALRLQALVLPALARVFYPALVEYRSDHERFVGAYRLGTVAIASLEALAAYFLFFNAEVVLLDIFLGPNWEPAVELLRILAFVPLVDALGRLGGEVLKARHEDRVWLLVVLLNLACLVGFGIAFSRTAGAEGMAWANYLVLGNLVMACRIYAACGAQTWRLLGDLLFVWIVPLPLLGGVALWLPPGGVRFAASIVAAGAVLAVVVWRFGPLFSRFFSGEQVAAEEER
jgi:O-antigen/teichoic acid export membrane protein